MPKFDTSTIEGFDAMSAEDKVTALLGVEIPEAVDMSLYVSKETFDKKASEAANLSKQLREKMSDDDRKKAEDQDALTKLQEQVDALTKDKDQLLKDKIISEYTANYLAQGFAKELAEETAKALADGDMDKVFKNQAKHNESLEAKIKADLMKADPKPGGGSGGKETDVAVEKAKELAKARFGNDKSYNDIMSKYKK